MEKILKYVNHHFGSDAKVIKTDLARKPKSILSDVKKLDSKLQTAEGKIDKAFLNYERSYKEFMSLLSDVESENDNLEGDLVKILDAAQELGVDGRDIDGFKESADMVLKITKLVDRYKKLYPRV